MRRTGDSAEAAGISFNRISFGELKIFAAFLNRMGAVKTQANIFA